MSGNTEEILHQFTSVLQLLVDCFRQNDAVAPKNTSLNPPGSDEETIEVLDSIIQATEAALDVISKHGIKRLVDFRRRRNDLSLVHRLPNETLSYIFEIAVHSTYVNRFGKHNFRPLCDIARVSHRWRRLTMENPRLWVEISLNDENTTLLKAFFRNSKQTPLEIGFCPKNPHQHPRFPEHMALLAPHIHRWKTCDLHYLPAQDLTIFLSDPAPLLESLSLNYGLSHPHTSSGVDTSEVHLFSGQTPRLRHLSIWCISISWNSQIYSNLASLRLGYVTYTMPDAILQLLRVLRGTPRLEVLCLEYLRFTGTVLSSAEPVVVLPLLQTLSIAAKQSSTPFYILSRITIPPSAQLQLTVHLQPHEGLGHVIPPQTTICSNIPSLSTARHLMVDYHGSSVFSLKGCRSLSEFEGYKFDFSLTFDTEDETTEGLLFDLGNIFPIHLDSVTLLYSHIDRLAPLDTSTTAAALSEFLDRQPSIKKIVFLYCPEEFIRTLSTTSPYLCPQLEMLKIVGCDDLSGGCLRAIVELRTRSHVGDDAATEDVFHLKHLWVEQWDAVAASPTILELRERLQVDYITAS